MINYSNNRFPATVRWCDGTLDKSIRGGVGVGVGGGSRVRARGRAAGQLTRIRSGVALPLRAKHHRCGNPSLQRRVLQ